MMLSPLNRRLAQKPEQPFSLFVIPAVRQWGPLLPILGLALALRAMYLPAVGFSPDIHDLGAFVETTHDVGLLRFYRYSEQRLYPPIATAALALVGEVQVRLLATHSPFADPILDTLFRPGFDPLVDPRFLTLIKMPPLLAELMLVVVAYAWLRLRPLLRWIVPGLLAISPGLIADSLWWGQYDALTVVFIVLALFAVNRDRPLLAWAFFALSLLTKQQAIVLTPLMVILTFRRYGLRRLIYGVLLCALLVVLIEIPFVVESGLHYALRPYLGFADPMKATTNGALNLWYLYSQQQQGRLYGYDWLTLGRMPDGQIAGVGLTYNQIGYILLGVYVLAVVASMWYRFTERREFVWATTLYMGAFMLPTEIHERYLYMAAVLVVFAVAQDWRLGLAALGVTFTFGYNLVQLADAVPLPGRDTIWLASWQLEVGLLNLILLLEVTRIALTRINVTWHVSRIILTFNRGALAFVALLFILAVPEALGDSATARWLTDHVAGYSGLVSERDAREVQAIAEGFGQAATWKWHYIASSDGVSAGSFLGAGAHYLVIDQRAHVGANFDSIVRDTQMQGATLLWQSNVLSGLVPRQAIFWTFHPEHMLNLEFDHNLMLVGYNMLNDRPGAVGLLMHWYTTRPPSVAYHLFFHLMDSVTGTLVAQADTSLGQGKHPADTWRTHEIVFEPYYLPTKSVPADGICHIRLGLYDPVAGTRAQITGEKGVFQGDTVEITARCAPASF